jgi:hypothetical protein
MAEALARIGANHVRGQARSFGAMFPAGAAGKTVPAAAVARRRGGRGTGERGAVRAVRVAARRPRARPASAANGHTLRRSLDCRDFRREDEVA